MDTQSSNFPPSTERVTEVKTDIFVTSIGPVSDHEMVSLCLLHPFFKPSRCLSTYRGVKGEGEGGVFKRYDVY